MSSEKLNSLIENVKEEYLSLVLDKNAKFGAEQMKEALNKTVEKIHTDIDEEADELIASVVNYLDNYNSKVDKSKYLPKEENSTEVAKDIKKKIKDLMSSLEGMISVTSINEEIVEYFRLTPLEKLINIKNNKLIFNNIRLNKNSVYVRGKKGDKDANDYIWNEKQVKYKNRSSTAEDGKLLKMNNSSCWNFTSIEPIVTDGFAELNLEVTDLKGDDHFYIGICNETKNLQTDSGCLCCSNPNTWYYDRSGKVSCDNIADSGKIVIVNKKDFIARVTVDYDAMEVSFEEDGNTSGPFKIKGKEFRFIVSACNTYTGNVRIL